MAWHLYLMPIVGAGTRSDKRRPDFVPALGVNWAMIDFGFQDVGLVAADVTNAQDTALQGEVGVSKIPDNLDSTVTVGTLDTVQNVLESRNIPGTWVNPGMSYRLITRVIVGVFFILQRYAFVANSIQKLITGAVTLSTQFQDLPAQTRQNLIQAADELNLDTSGFTGASTIRQILRGVGAQASEREFIIAGITV